MSSRMEVHMEVYGSCRKLGAMVSDCHGNPQPSFLGVITHKLGCRTFIFHGFGVQGWVIRYNLDFNFQPTCGCGLLTIDPKFQRDIPSRTCCPNPIKSQVLEVEKRTEEEYSYTVGPPPVMCRVTTPLTGVIIPVIQFITPLKGARKLLTNVP